MKDLTPLYPGIVSGIIYLGFLVLLFLALRMLPPDSPKAKTLKISATIWVLLAALWLIFKPK